MSYEKTLVISAHATVDHMSAVPEFVSVHSPDVLLERILGLQKLAIDNNLSEVRVYNGADWGPDGIEEELRLVCGELVVTNRSFWFVDTPKHSDGHVETTLVDIVELQKALQVDQPVYFLGNDLDSLKERYEESLMAKADDEEEGEE